MKKILFCLSIVLALTAQTSYGEKWQTVGARAMAMGGAGVAAATGSAQQYYNPALLATQDNLHNNDVMLNVNAELEATEKILTAASKLKDMTDKFNTIKNLSGQASADQMKSIAETLSAIKDMDLNNTGALINTNAGIATKLKKLAISVRSYVSAGITPIVDTQNISLTGTGTNISLGSKSTATGYESSADKIKNVLDKYGLTSSLGSLLGHSEYSSTELANAIINMAKDAGSTDAQITAMADALANELPNAADIIKAASTGGNYSQNKTQVLVDAGAFTELAVGYGYEVFKGIQIGGNIKFINGQMAETGIMVLSDKKKMEKTVEDAFDNRKSSNNVGVDLGVLFDFSKFFERDIILSPSVGLVARNINSPSFDRPNKPSSVSADLQWNSGSYSLDRQVRAGAALKPLNWLTVAADIDLTENKTTVSGFNSRDLAFGAEINLINKKSFYIPLRAGINKNIANSNAALEYTLGTGISGTGFTLELAGGVSSKKTKIDGNEIPASASVALNLGVLF